MRDYTKFLWLWIKKALFQSLGWGQSISAVLVAAFSYFNEVYPEGKIMFPEWKVFIFGILAAIFVRILFAPYLLWKEEKEKSVNGKKLRLTEDEKQTSCADFVTILFNDLFDNFSTDGLTGSGIAAFGGYPPAHYAYRQLEKTAKNLLVDPELVRSINSYLNYFVCEGNLGIAGISDSCKIKTVFETKRQLDDNISKVRQEAKLLAEKIKDITR